MSKPDSLVEEARRMAQHAQRRGLTQSAIAEALNASQSQVSRILAGTSKRRSKLFDAVCKYVFYDGMAGAHQGGEIVDLHAELDAIWDGSNAHAQALAGVIRSLGALRPRPHDKGGA